MFKYINLRENVGNIFTYQQRYRR